MLYKLHITVLHKQFSRIFRRDDQSNDLHRKICKMLPLRHLEKS